LTSKFKNARKSFEEFRDIMLSSKKIKPGDRVLVLTGEGEDVSWSNSIRVATVPKK
jgi:hypothetical protein